MSLVIAFHRAASAEFSAASAWYENKRQGLALAFMAEIDRCVSQAAKQPLQYAIVHQDIRRAVVRNFPYSVYFRLEPQRIVGCSIVAVILMFDREEQSNLQLGKVVPPSDKSALFAPISDLLRELALPHMINQLTTSQ